MIDTPISVELEGAPGITVKPDARDIRKWEGATGKSWLAQEIPSITDMTRLAFFAAIRSGSFSGSWDDFDNGCVSLELGEGPKATEPTDPEPSDG